MKGQHYDAIVSVLEPKLVDGLTFSEEVKGRPVWPSSDAERAGLGALGTTAFVARVSDGSDSVAK